MTVLEDISHTALGLDKDTIIFHTVFVQKGFDDLIVHVIQVSHPIYQSVGDVLVSYDHLLS